MPAQILRQLLKTSYESCDQGLRIFVADLFDEDIEGTLYFPPEALPIPNWLRGKTAALEALKRIDKVV